MRARTRIVGAFVEADVWGRWTASEADATMSALAGFLIASSIWIWFASGLPSSEKLLAYQPPLPTNVRGYDGNPVQTFARERRVELAFDEYPDLVINAFIAAEDKTFFSHGGLDYPGLIGAVGDFVTKSATGGGRAGFCDDGGSGGDGAW